MRRSLNQNHKNPGAPKGKRRKAEVRFDKSYQYNLVKDGKVVHKTDCVHEARSEANRLKAQFWRIQRSGQPLLIWDYGKDPK